MKVQVCFMDASTCGKKTEKAGVHLGAEAGPFPPFDIHCNLDPPWSRGTCKCTRIGNLDLAPPLSSFGPCPPNFLTHHFPPL